MDLKVTQENGRIPITVIHVDGNLDSSTYLDFQSKVRKLIDEGTRYILVDLAHVPYISSSGLRALHEIYNKLRGIHPDANLKEEELLKGISSGMYKSPHLKLLNLSKDVQSAIKMGGFDMYLETFTELHTAIASF